MSRRGTEQGLDAYLLTAYVGTVGVTRTSIRDDPEECTHVMYPFPAPIETKHKRQERFLCFHSYSTYCPIIILKMVEESQS